MNLFFAELLGSVPPEFSVKDRMKNSIQLQYQNKYIYISWHENGQPYKIAYSENGIRHRPISEGPSIRTWYSDGQLWEFAYSENGRWHRPASEGPAIQSWNQDGSLRLQEYWENGLEIKGLTKD